MSPRNRVTPFIFVAALAACSAEDRLLEPTPGTANTALAVSPDYPNGLVVVGDFAFVLVNEAGQSEIDLNDDDDVADNVVFRVNTVTGAAINLGRTAEHNMATDGRSVVWVTSEESEDRDLNGDGDQADHVLSVFDTQASIGGANPRFVTSSVNPTVQLQADDGYFAFLMFGGTVSVLEVRSFVNNTPDSVYQTGVAPNPGGVAYTLRNGVLAFTGSEEDSGLSDFNSDGDTSDITLFVHRVGSGVNISIPRAVDPFGFTIVGTPADPVVAYAIDEANDGASANAAGIHASDLDTTDMIAACFDVVTATEVLPGMGLAIQPERLVGSTTHLILSAIEAENGTIPADFSNDGSSDDFVPFWVDLSNLAVVNNVGVEQDDGTSSSFPHVCGEYMFVLADEASRGSNGTNFNSQFGDIDAEDTILTFVDMRTPNVTNVTNMGVAATQMLCPNELNPEWVLAILPESDNGESDLNGDLDDGDEVIAYFPINSSGQISTELRIPRGGGTSNSVAAECGDSIAIFSFSEEGSDLFFRDLNVDLDEDDVVATVQIISKVTHEIGDEQFLGTVRSLADGETELTDFPILAGAHTLLFPSLEASIGEGVDHNGDGDMSDSVLFSVSIPCTE